MTNSITDIKKGVPGDMKYTIRDIDITSYTTGGEAIGPEELGLAKLHGLFAQSIETPLLFVHDNVNDGKFKGVMTFAGTNEAGTITITVNGVAIAVPVLAHDGVPADTLSTIAAKVKAAVEAVCGDKFYVSVSTDTVTMLSKANSAIATLTFGAGATGVTCTPTKTYPLLKAYVVGGDPGLIAEVTNATDIGVVKVLSHGL